MGRFCRLLVLSATVWLVGYGWAHERLELCFGYGCNEEVGALILESELDRVAVLFADVGDAASERDAVANAVGALYRLVGGQTPVFMDRGGNYADDEAYGRMDCIDHSTTTTRMLALMARRGWLRFHEVEEPARRARIFTQHFSARMRERSALQQANGDDTVDMSQPDHVAVLLALCDCPEVAEDGMVRTAQDETARDLAGEQAFVVDSWFRDNGEPAVVMPLAEWMNGEGPNVE